MENSYGLTIIFLLITQYQSHDAAIEYCKQVVKTNTASDFATERDQLSTKTNMIFGIEICKCCGITPSNVPYFLRCIQT